MAINSGKHAVFQFKTQIMLI